MMRNPQHADKKNKPVQNLNERGNIFINKNFTASNSHCQAKHSKIKQNSYHLDAGAFKPYLRDYLQRLGINTSQNFRCPNTSAHKNGDKTPSMHYYESGHNAYCHACGVNWDIFSFIGHYEVLSEFRDQLARANELFGNGSSLLKKNESAPVTASDKAADKPAPIDPAFFKQAQRDMSQGGYAYLEARGISRSTADQFGVGYCAQWRHPKAPIWAQEKPVIIYPTKSGYTARDVRADADIPVADRRYKKQKTGSPGFFGVDCLYSDGAAAVVEGEADALTFREAGCSDVALGSVSNAKKFIELLKSKPIKSRLILALDQDEAGKVATNQLSAELNRLQIPFSLFEMDQSPLNSRGEPCKDPNEWLVSDRDSFITAVSSAIENALATGAAARAVDEASIVDWNNYTLFQPDFQAEPTKNENAVPADDAAGTAGQGSSPAGYVYSNGSNTAVNYQEESNTSKQFQNDTTEKQYHDPREPLSGGPNVGAKEPQVKNETQAQKVINGEGAPWYAYSGKFMPYTFSEIFSEIMTFKVFNDTLYMYNTAEGTYTCDKLDIDRNIFKLDRGLKINNIKEVRAKLLSFIDIQKTDEPPNLIPFASYILDFHTSEHINYSPNSFFRNKIPYDYNPAAKDDDEILSIIYAIAGHDKEIVQLIFQMIGYCFWRENRFRGGALLKGKRGTGKSTLLNIVKQIFGENNTSHLTLHEIEQRFKTIHLRDKLINVGDDIPSRFIEDISTFKKAATGETITVEEKGQPAVDITPFAKHWFACNQLPRVNDASDAFVSRIYVIELGGTCFSDKPDTSYHNRVWSRTAIECIIRHAMDGLRALFENDGFSVPETVRSANREYSLLNDPVAAFIDDQGGDIYVDSRIGKVTDMLFHEYKVWCETNGHKHNAKNGFMMNFHERAGTFTSKERVGPDLTGVLRKKIN